MNNMRVYLFDSSQLVLFAAVAVTGAVPGFNFVNEVRDQLDPRTRLELGL
jgi:ABC-type dipeptide/oligopeptide/nickel transport system permease subunit